MTEATALVSLPVSNRCVLMRALDAWTDPASPAWPLIKGEQDTVEAFAVVGPVNIAEGDSWQSAARCPSHSTGNGTISAASVISATCRPSRIASAMLGANNVSRRTRLRCDGLKLSAVSRRL